MKLNKNIVPSTLDEAVIEILSNLSEEDKKNIRNTDSSLHHFSIGMYLRNNWSLWEENTPIKNHFKNVYGLSHADDLSGIILDAVFCDTKGIPRNTNKLVERYKKHWISSGVDPLTFKKIKGHKPKTSFQYKVNKSGDIEEI